jgi:hypothetical protein
MRRNDGGSMCGAVSASGLVGLASAAALRRMWKSPDQPWQTVVSVIWIA